MIHLSRVGLLLWSAIAVVAVIEVQTLAAFVDVHLGLTGMFVVWLAIVAVLVLLTIWPEPVDGAPNRV